MRLTMDQPTHLRGRNWEGGHSPRAYGGLLRVISGEATLFVTQNFARAADLIADKASPELPLAMSRPITSNPVSEEMSGAHPVVSFSSQGNFKAAALHADCIRHQPPLDCEFAMDKLSAKCQAFRTTVE